MYGVLTTPAAVRLQRPVISVGNLAMGGRGKTPLVAEIARLLVEAGERPAILSRGYGRRVVEDGAVVVSDGTHLLADIDRAGDEPLLLARAVPGAAVVVCEQRAIAGALAEAVLDATVHVLDDGFQHRALARDVDIVVMGPADFSGRRAPFGRLREPVSALARAHAVIVDEATDAADDLTERRDRAAASARNGQEAVARASSDARRLTRAEVFGLARELGDPVPLEPERGQPDLDAVLAVAGIAAPWRFVRALEARGIRVAYAIEYRDHHAYSRRDVAHIAATARQRAVSAVLTTEKDAMRLLPHRPLPVPMAAMPLRARVEPAAAFRSWLLARLAEARS
jgi:tetraacyldisaccharide 4'-kinase